MPSPATAVRRPSDAYLRLVREFPLRPIRDDAELAYAVAAIDRLVDRMDALTEDEAAYLDVLADLVEKYERAHEPAVPRMSDAKMLRYLIEQKQVTQTEVAARTGIAQSTLSAVISRRRTLTRDQVGRLAKYFRVDPGLFSVTRR